MQQAAEHKDIVDGLEERCGRRPRTGCRAEARRRRDAPGRRRNDSQHESLHGSQTDPSPLCEKLSTDAAGTASLRSHFSELDRVPCERIFLVRKIQRLGLGSADAVRTHFSSYGEVEDVLVAHSPVLSGCKTYVRRLRPSNLAIVIMKTATMADRVHAEGKDQVVQGSSVLVEPYERRGQNKADDEHDVATCDTTSCGESAGDVSLDADSLFDGSSSNHADVFSSSDQEDSEFEDEAYISGKFEYYATDDEGEW